MNGVEREVLRIPTMRVILNNLLCWSCRDCNRSFHQIEPRARSFVEKFSQLLCRSRRVSHDKYVPTYLLTDFSKLQFVNFLSCEFSIHTSCGYIFSCSKLTSQMQSCTRVGTRTIMFVYCTAVVQ